MKEQKTKVSKLKLTNDQLERARSKAGEEFDRIILKQGLGLSKPAAKRIVSGELLVDSGLISINNFKTRKPGGKFISYTIEITNEDLINLAKIKLGGVVIPRKMIK